MKSSKIFAISIIFLLFGLSHCAHPQKELPPPAYGKPYLKWTLKFTGFKMTTESLEQVKTVEPMLPPGIGDHKVVASYKGKEVASFPFALPKATQTDVGKTIVKEKQPPSSFEPLEKEELQKIILTVWIPLERRIDLISILDPKGNLVVSEKKLSNGRRIENIRP